ncbi:serine/threonine-protein phosphatase 7 long form homolog [Arachis stenosperma]|uniref:serine/threonine-protein phosphatase 7 long form homolog n=1 Tax=Arachis stenosperma TaxID=217475 RepID=UPI0025ABE2A2|nr:serine/threonine-protein phosphatase 7 long form homolog [Arachis stenosperma]
MAKRHKARDVDRPELHIVNYLSNPDYSSRMITCDHPLPPDRYHPSVEDHLRVTGFYHASQIGVVQGQKALINALVERWRPETHTFHLPIGECTVTLEDVAVILGLPTNGLPVTGMTLSSFEALEGKCFHQFGVAPRKADCRGSGIKMTWLRNLKERIQLTDENSMQRYVKCHIMLLLGTILLGDKSGASVHWKFLPLLRDFHSISNFSWGSACLAHLYRSLCRASCFDCKEIDGPLTLLLGWFWIRLPYLAPPTREPRSFPLANRWRNWERGDNRYRYLSLAYFREALDEVQEGQFVWVAYGVDRIEPGIIPEDIFLHAVVWSATVPLISFESIEWHATDRVRRQFGLVQGVPSEETNLGRAHGETLAGPKNLDWATAPSHSCWIMRWTNRYNYILCEYVEPSQHPLDVYMDWYRARYGKHLRLSNVVVQENDEGEQVMDDEGNPSINDEGSPVMEDEGSPVIHVANEEPVSHSHPHPPLPPASQEQFQASVPYHVQTQYTPSYPIDQQYWSTPQWDAGEGASFSQLLGFMAADAGQSQFGHQPEFMPGRYSLDARIPCHTASVASGGLETGDSSRSEGGRGIFTSRNLRRVSMGQIEENAGIGEHETDQYLVEEPDDEEMDEDQEESEDDEMDEDEESRNNAPDDADDAGETGKHYNLRVDPPRRSANRYTPSMFKKAKKKCKNILENIKWATRK